MTRPSPRHSVSRAIRARDAGLTRVSVVTRVLVAASVAGAALFSALAAWAQPGRAKTLQSAAASSQVVPGGTSRLRGFGTRTTTTAPSDDGSSATTPATDASGGGAAVQQLSPPATAPAPDYQYTSPAPVVVSGAS